MAKCKNKGLPHHVKERLRHQNLQKILEDVAGHVPKPKATKKETKAKNLRRVVLYMKYLIHIKKKLDETEIAIKNIPKSQENAVKSSKTFPEHASGNKPKRKKAQIVFLSKCSDKSSNRKDSATLIYQKLCSKTENESEIQAIRNTINTINQSKTKNVFSPENNEKLIHVQSNKSAVDMTDRYVPNMEMENASYSDISLWNDSCPAVYRSDPEKKIGKTETIYLSKGHTLNKHQNGISEKENSLIESPRNGTDLKQYIQTFSKDLEDVHKTFSPNENLDKRCTNSYSSEKGPYFSYTDVERDKPQQINKSPFIQSSDYFSFKDMSATTPLSSFEMPVSLKNVMAQKSDHQHCDSAKLDTQSLKYEMQSRKTLDSSPDLFSSGESGVFTTLHTKLKPNASSARRNDFQPIQCDIIVDKRQFPKYSSFSQSSDNFSSEIFSSGESSTVISSNEYVYSENEPIGFADSKHHNNNTSLSASFRPETAMNEDCNDNSLTPPISSPDIFCDIKQDAHHRISDFSIGNILPNSCKKHPFSPNSEPGLDYNIHGFSYNIPVFHNTTFNNVIDGRYLNYFGMNNYSQNLPFYGLPRFSTIGNYPNMKIGDVRRYSQSGTTDKNCMTNSYFQEKENDYHHSMYTNEGIENHTGVRIKQEDPEPFLPSEELSYSFNNFTNSEFCYSQRDFNAH